MRLGFDVDGVLANFEDSYRKVVVKVTGKDLFTPHDPVKGPLTWDWDKDAGYTPEEIDRVWHHINHEAVAFWMRLAPAEGAGTLSLMMQDLENRHDLYFITSRPGATAKRQTECWLRNYLDVVNPTVLISSEKGLCARALKLDAYIDDRWENCRDVATEVLTGHCHTQNFLLDKNYNRQHPLPWEAMRVNTVGQMLDYLILGL